MQATPLEDFYSNERDYSHFLHYKYQQYPDLFERVTIVTPWHIVEEVFAGNYQNIDERVAQSLAYDVSKVIAQNLW